MRKARSVALIAAGKLLDSPLPRLPGLAGRLGPVKSRSVRLASRIANSLRGGHPVRSYADLGGCRLILVSVPDQITAATVSELLASELSWPGKSVILCSPRLDSSELREIGRRGASVASFCEVAGASDAYLIEGDRPAIREMRHAILARASQMIVLEPRGKPNYLAASTCTGSVLFGLVHAASESLRGAGVSSPVVASILQRQINRTVRSYLKAGRKAFPAAQDLERQLTGLRSSNPSVAAYIERSAEQAAALLDCGR